MRKLGLTPWKVPNLMNLSQFTETHWGVNLHDCYTVDIPSNKIQLSQF